MLRKNTWIMVITKCITMMLNVVQVKEQVQPGQVVQLAPNVIAKVVEIGEDSLTLDFNHPLAGLKLTFEVDVIAVKDAPTLFGTPMVKFTPPGQPR